MYDACVPWPERPKGAKDKSRGPKGLELEVGARRAPKLLVSDIVQTGTVLNRQTDCGGTQRIRFSFKFPINLVEIEDEYEPPNPNLQVPPQSQRSSTSSEEINVDLTPPEERTQHRDWKNYTTKPS